METVYLVCALLGGTLMLGQLVLMIFGHGGHDDVGHAEHFGGDHAVGHEGEVSWLFGVLSFRTLTAAFAFFGLAGLGASQRLPDDPVVALLIALAAGLAALVLVAWVLRLLHRFQAEGTVRIDRAIGAAGTVYLPIPGGGRGAGKVMVNVQNRTMEYQAITAQPQELPTGTRVSVVAVVGPGTVEVAPAS